MKTEDATVKSVPIKQMSNTKRIFLSLATIAAVVAVGLMAYAGYIYSTTPAVIRRPLLEHYHFRMQIIVNGKAEDFSGKTYQQDYAKGQCNDQLPEQPIHFHDGKDQFTHIHWEGITGGLVMKYYGWNFIGGPNNSLGYRIDNLKHPQKVSTHGSVLPELPKDAQFYIYTGNQTTHKQRTFDNWKNQDLEKFFGTTSNFPAHKLNMQKTSMTNLLFPKASAHGAAGMPHTAAASSLSGTETLEEERTRVGNLIGNVVIFVQKTQPTEKQISDKFNHLEPLSDSTCGG